MRRWWGWALLPVLWLAAALIASARGGMLIVDGVAQRMPWHVVFAGALADYLWWVLLGPLVVIAVRRISDARWRLPAQVGAHVAACALTAAAYWQLRARVHLPWVSTTLSAELGGLTSSLPTSVGLYVVIAAGALAAYAYSHARTREREAAELTLHASRLETDLTEARLGALRSQLHPHFLFNALHAISTLIEVHPDAARRMLVQLSELLRMTLEFTTTAEVPLTREVEWLEHYVELQQTRFGDRLTVNLRIAPETMTARVPPLVLQPLVENAIRHGLERRAGAGRIDVWSEVDDRHASPRLRLRVADDGPGPPASDAVGAGIGLRNTRARLRALYGDDHHLEVRSRTDNGSGAEAIVEMPFREAPARADSGRSAK